METVKEKKVLTIGEIERLPIGAKELGELAEDRQNPLFWKKRLDDARGLLSRDVNSQLEGIGLLRSVVAGIGSSSKFKRPEIKEEALNDLLGVVDSQNPEIRIASIFALGSLAQFMTMTEIGRAIGRIKPHAAYDVMKGEDNRQVVQVSMMSLMQFHNAGGDVLGIIDEQLNVDDPLINAQATYALTLSGVAGANRIRDRLIRNPEKSELLVRTLVSTGRHDVLRQIVIDAHDSLSKGQNPGISGDSLFEVSRGLLSSGDEKDVQRVGWLFNAVFDFVGGQHYIDPKVYIDPILRSDPVRLWPEARKTLQGARDEIERSGQSRIRSAYDATMRTLMDVAVDLSTEAEPVGLEMARFITEGKYGDYDYIRFMSRFNFENYGNEGLQLRNGVRDTAEESVRQYTRRDNLGVLPESLQLLMAMDDSHSVPVVRGFRDALEQQIRRRAEDEMRRYGQTIDRAAFERNIGYKIQDSHIPRLDEWLQRHEQKTQ